MTKEQKDKILKALAEDRNDYMRDCQEQIEKEWGKIEGADYMLQRFLDVINTEIELQERSGEEADERKANQETSEKADRETSIRY